MERGTRPREGAGAVIAAVAVTLGFLALGALFYAALVREDR
jgi:hypothetical protein